MSYLTIESIWFEFDEWSEPYDENDCNTDVIFTLDDSTKWVATFYTYQNILSLSQKNKITDENLNGLYFCATDMIIIDKVTRENIQKVLNEIIANDEIDIYCTRLQNDTNIVEPDIGWKQIEDLKDDDKIYSGALIRFYNKEKAIGEAASLPINPTDYIISEIYGNNDYLQLTCISQGEGGNIGSVLKSLNGHYTLGAEIKRMLVSDLYQVLINFEAEIVIQ